MNTYQTTAEMLQGLSEDDLLKVKAFIAKLFAAQNGTTQSSYEAFNPYKPLTREEIFARIEESRRAADAGEVYPAHNASDRVREKYGL